MNDQLEWLQRWYAKQCDGDWEDAFGVEIGTLDNPGWRVDIDLAETPLSGLMVERVSIERCEVDWVDYQIDSDKFQGRGGPGNLRELIQIFRGYWEHKRTDTKE